MNSSPNESDVWAAEALRRLLERVRLAVLIEWARRADAVKAWRPGSPE